ncbi:MAG: co-chaperone GroES [Dehalococcoidia bacterium]|nr:co-chaperone GroES [Dehalococcoidia bacterium]
MKAILDRVIIEPDAKEGMFGSIIIPDDSRKRQHRGTVICCGTGRHNKKGVFVPVGVSPGDVVYYNRYDGIDFDDEGKEYVCILDKDIVGKE